MSRWKWINHEGGALRDVGVNADGTLHNPNGYPEGSLWEIESPGGISRG
jgi:hypothetical protein